MLEVQNFDPDVSSTPREVLLVEASHACATLAMPGIGFEADIYTGGDFFFMEESDPIAQPGICVVSALYLKSAIHVYSVCSPQLAYPASQVGFSLPGRAARA